MTNPLKTFWPVLALVAGALLIVLEFRRPGGPSGESWFWIAIAAIIVLMALIGLVQKQRS